MHGSLVLVQAQATARILRPPRYSTRHGGFRHQHKGNTGYSSLDEYSKPLLDFLAELPRNEKVILAGHSFGGLNIALAMDKFPEKIEVAVFLTAFMPDIHNRPSFVLDQFIETISREQWLDIQFPALQHLTAILFGPEFLTSKLAQLSPVEDLELAKTLLRPSSLFIDHLSNAKNYTSEGYGSVSRVFIMCEEDKAITKEFQRWMIASYPVEQVITIAAADHMVIFSKPEELSHSLLLIAHKYA